MRSNLGDLLLLLIFFCSLCEQDLDVCGHVMPCLRGRCINTGPDSYYCECPTNYHEDNCQLQTGGDLPTVSCSDFPCENDGTCIPVNDSYTCSCLDGYEGENCSMDVDMCRHSSPCFNGATCVNTGPNAYHCQCTSGYNGSNCEDATTDTGTQTNHDLSYLPIIAGSVGGALLLMTLILCITFYTVRRKCLAHKRKHPKLEATSHLYSDVSVPLSPTTSSMFTSSHQIASELPDSSNQITDSSTTIEPEQELVNPLYTETEHYYSVITPTGRQDTSFEYNRPSQYGNNMEPVSSRHHQQQDRRMSENNFNRRELSPYYNVIGERSHDNQLPAAPASNTNHHHARLLPEDTYSQPVDALTTANQPPLYHVLEHNTAASNTKANTTGTMKCSPPPVYQVLERPSEPEKVPISTMYEDSKSQHSHGNNAAASVLPDYDSIDN